MGKLVQDLIFGGSEEHSPRPRKVQAAPGGEVQTPPREPKRKAEMVRVAPGVHGWAPKDAAAKVADLIAEEGNPDLKLRVFVQGGGCSGFQYGFTFDEIVNDDDFQIEKDGLTFLVDPMSYQYLLGAEIDYTESLHGSQFVIRNPNATTTCGCGSSFSV